MREKQHAGSLKLKFCCTFVLVLIGTCLSSQPMLAYSAKDSAIQNLLPTHAYAFWGAENQSQIGSRASNQFKISSRASATEYDRQFGHCPIN